MKFYNGDLPEELRAMLAAASVAPQAGRDWLDGNRRPCQAPGSFVFSLPRARFTCFLGQAVASMPLQ